MDRYRPESLHRVPVEILNIRLTNRDGHMTMDDDFKANMLKHIDNETSKRRDPTTKSGGPRRKLDRIMEFDRTS
jgi:hypothetical protein